MFSLGMVNMTYGQSMTDNQVVEYAIQLKKSGASESDIAAKLMQRGATMDQIQRVRKQYAKQMTTKGLDDSVDNMVGNTKDRMRVNNEVNDNDIITNAGELAPEYAQRTTSADQGMGKKVFGRDIFNNKSLTFEPVMNIATPQNYVLGPGDQLVIDVYGDTQRSESLTVSPDGDVTVPDYGPVHVAGLTVAAAQSRVRSHRGEY